MRSPTVRAPTRRSGTRRASAARPAGARVHSPTPRAARLLAAARSQRQLALAGSIVGSLLLVALLAWPLVLSNATFNKDWLNHLWYVWHESRAIRANALPSFFVEYSGGVFYPLFAFYGGTLYSLTGALALALGDAPLVAYVLSYLLGFAAAYGGWYWLSRMFGVGRWLAHVPGIVFVTSAAYLTTVYALGDWPEFLAVSMMPPMVASALAVLRAERLRFAPAAALAASSVVFFGSHLLTVVWGSTVLVLTGAALLAFVPAARARARWLYMRRVLAIVLPALLVSAWFLLPAAAYESKTVIARSYVLYRSLLEHDMYTINAKNLFTLSRAPASGSLVTTALPVLAIAWVLAGLCVVWRERRRDTWMRVLAVLSTATAALLVVMTHAGIILALPRLYATVQFGLRLESYVLLGISGSVLGVLVLNRGRARRHELLTWALAPIVVVSVIGAAQQVAAHPKGLGRGVALSSYLKPTYEHEGLLDYVDDGIPIIKARLPRLTFPPLSVRDDRVSALVHYPPGQRLDTNIRSGPEFVHVSGARIVGTDREANDVLEVDRASGAHAGAHGSATARRITVSQASGTPIVIGRLLTVIALIAIALELSLLAARTLWRGRGSAKQAREG
ncbi:MAG TPA: hypothetical protein VNV42_01575 [Solirubrobacteraceae bacterium]|nr:hypothetical protein [Solirubrobacteraceae bacterium]